MTRPSGNRAHVSHRFAWLAALGVLATSGCAADGSDPFAGLRKSLSEMGQPADAAKPAAVQAAPAAAPTLTPEALAVLQAAAKAAPSDVMAQYNYAQALSDAGRTQEALDVAKPADAVARGDVKLGLLTGELQLRVKDAAAAEVTYRKVLLTAPEDIEALNGMGIAEVMQGSLAWAEADFRRAAVLAPADARTRNNIGLAMALQGRARQAIPMLEALLIEDAGSARVRNNLALAYAVSGRQADAIKTLTPIMSQSDAEAAVAADLKLAASMAAANAAPPAPAVTSVSKARTAKVDKPKPTPLKVARPAANTTARSVPQVAPNTDTP